VLEQQQPSELVLGSASPRRREILLQIGVPFVVITAAADESVRPGEAVPEYLDRVVRAKLAAVSVAATGRAPDAKAVLVADTTVVDGEAMLGKPESPAEALSMIERLSGKTHEVHTRFLLAARDGAVLHAETVVTRVTFRALSPVEARAYADSGEGMDKAGGYAVQGLASAFVSRIEGSYTNVVGLPACEVAVALLRLGLR
jgi:septum formation protein